MGNKVKTTGFRTGISRDWKSKWFAGKSEYGTNVIEDIKIREFFENRLSNAGLEEVLIERSINSVTITLKVSRPGVVIGRGGAGVKLLNDDLAKIVKSKISITVEEVRDAESSAVLIAKSISSQIKHRVHYRRAVLSSLQKAEDLGVKGIRIMVSGVLSGGNSISRREPYMRGSIPQTTIKANIDYGEVATVTSYGVIGIKVWVYKG
ncbi:30S ribosomal protein S3 [bacterium]|nr:30S ribosomal protein S3 [bacterium]